jgi:hypothetical protein
MPSRHDGRIHPLNGARLRSASSHDLGRQRSATRLTVRTPRAIHHIMKPQRQLHLARVDGKIAHLIELLQARLEVPQRVVMPTPRRPSANDTAVVPRRTRKAARLASCLPAIETCEIHDCLCILKNLSFLTRFIRFTNRLVIPLLMRRELFARKTLGNDPVPAARRAHSAGIEGMPNRSAPAHLLLTNPPIRGLGSPPTFRAEDFRTATHKN